ncbi:MAG: hypothetical protein M3281_09420 [Chloroflexota bacterium]|nr:hypothetical protein [Chloroflexota bacterium]
MSHSRATGIIGVGLEWLIQAWVRASRRRVDLSRETWLDGPTGNSRVGLAFYSDYARERGLCIETHGEPLGLLPDFARLASATFDPTVVHPEIVRFYERTSEYELDVWSHWSGLLKPFAYSLIAFVSRNIEQLNLPLSPLETSYGMSSELVRLVDADTGEVVYAGWLRRTLSSGGIIYAGLYTTCQPPRVESRHVKVVFPLPGGSATVLLRPEHLPDGSLNLVSDGSQYGGAGYYRLHRTGRSEAKIRLVPIKETIHVYFDRHGVLRTHHAFRFGPLPLLTLHYKLTRKPERQASS